MGLPAINGFKLNRGEEMMVGVGIPFLLLLVNEWIQSRKIQESEDYTTYRKNKLERKRKSDGAAIDKEELKLVKKQNQFGLKIIAFSLLVTALILFALSLFTASGKGMTAIVGFIVLLAAIIPWIASKKVKRSIAALDTTTV